MIKPYIAILKDHPFEPNAWELIFGLEPECGLKACSVIFKKSTKTNVFELWNGIKKIPIENLKLPVWMG